jgi:hypothetical protein
MWLRTVAKLAPCLRKPFERLHRDTFNDAKFEDITGAAKQGMEAFGFGAQAELMHAWKLSRRFAYAPDVVGVAIQPGGQRAQTGRVERAVADTGFCGKNIRVGPPSELPPFPHAPAPHTPARRPLGFVTNSRRSVQEVSSDGKILHYLARYTAHSTKEATRKTNSHLLRWYVISPLAPEAGAGTPFAR